MGVKWLESSPAESNLWLLTDIKLSVTQSCIRAKVHARAPQILHNQLDKGGGYLVMLSIGKPRLKYSVGLASTI